MIGITPKSDKGLTYTGIAEALSIDYIDIYVVDLDTDRFTEYAPGGKNSDISLERSGDDFFTQARQDAATFVHENDRDEFVKNFTKEKIVNAIDEYGVFTYTYRADFYGDCVYVNMKALRMSGAENRIIIGVNNVDAQMREQETLAKLQEEKATYSKIAALMGDLIAIYTVDPDDGTYMMYASSHEFSELGTTRAGLDFFADSNQEILKHIHPDDYEMFIKNFTKENVLKQTEGRKVFILNYRLKFGDAYQNVCLRAGMVREKEDAQLVVGVSLA